MVKSATSGSQRQRLRKVWSSKPPSEPGKRISRPRPKNEKTLRLNPRPSSVLQRQNSRIDLTGPAFLFRDGNQPTLHFQPRHFAERFPTQFAGGGPQFARP